VGHAGQNWPRPALTWPRPEKSQLLTDRSGPRRSKLAAASTNVAKAGKSGGSRVEENRRKIESQLEKAYAKGTKPSPNAVAVGRSNAANQENSLKNESFSSISEMDNEANSRRPKRWFKFGSKNFLCVHFFLIGFWFLLFLSGLKSNLSESSSIWISETHEISNAAPNPHNNANIINKGTDSDRPATANSLKTSNFDSDEETVPNWSVFIFVFFICCKTLYKPYFYCQKLRLFSIF